MRVEGGGGGDRRAFVQVDIMRVEIAFPCNTGKGERRQKEGHEDGRGRQTLPLHWSTTFFPRLSLSATSCRVCVKNSPWRLSISLLPPLTLSEPPTRRRRREPISRFSRRFLNCAIFVTLRRIAQNMLTTSTTEKFAQPFVN